MSNARTHTKKDAVAAQASANPATHETVALCVKPKPVLWHTAGNTLCGLRNGGCTRLCPVRLPTTVYGRDACVMSFSGELRAVLGMAILSSADGARNDGDADSNAGGTGAPPPAPRAVSAAEAEGGAAPGLASPSALSASLSPSVRLL